MFKLFLVLLVVSWTFCQASPTGSDSPSRPPNELPSNPVNSPNNSDVGDQISVTTKSNEPISSLPVNINVDQSSPIKPIIPSDKDGGNNNTSKTTISVATSNTSDQNPKTSTTIADPPHSISPADPPYTTTTAKTTTKLTTTSPSPPSTSPPTLPTTTSPTTSSKPTTPSTIPPPPSTTGHPKPNSGGGFNVISFLGGMILGLGLLAIGYVVFKFYQTRRDSSYRTL